MSMTIDQHHECARELWTICNATRRLWLNLGDAEGPFRPEGEAMAIVREWRDKLAEEFGHDFPADFNPYPDIEC